LQRGSRIRALKETKARIFQERKQGIFSSVLASFLLQKHTLKIPHRWVHRPTRAAHTYTVVVRKSVQSAPPVRAVAVQAWPVSRLLSVTGHGESRGLSLARHTCTYEATSRTGRISQQFQCMGVCMSTHRLVPYTRRHAWKCGRYSM